jgi:hypothetical protein
MAPAYPNPLPTIVEVLDAAIRADLESLRYEYFIGLLICTGAVFAGLVCEVGEIWHDAIGFFKRHQFAQEYEATPAQDRKERQPSHSVKMWTAVGWLLIVIGVGGEGVFDGLVSWADSTLQTFNNILLEAAQKEAGSAAKSAKTAREESTTARTEADAGKLSAGEALKRARAAEHSLAKAEADAGKAQAAAANALTTATDAAARAGKAEASLGRAEAEARNSETSASDALTLARGARKEANSFERELDRIRLPRTLIRQAEFNLKMRPFFGTEYTFASVFQDEESITFLRILDAALQDAGWKRVTPPGGFPAINVFGPAENFAVPVGFGTGIVIVAESNERLSSLENTQEIKLPSNLRAAVALDKALDWSISPREEIAPLTPVGVVSGTSMTVRIAVGKKK